MTFLFFSFSDFQFCSPLCLPLVFPCCVSPEAGWLEDFDLTSTSLSLSLSCAKFLFPSPYLPVPTSCGTCFLPTCQFRPWKSHSGLGSPMSCAKFLFPSPYLPVPALDVTSPTVNSSSCLRTCQFRPWKSHVMW